MSTFDPYLNVELIGDSERSNTWGESLDVSLQKITAATNQFLSLNLTGVNSPFTITTIQGQVDNACANSYQFTGTLTGNMTVQIPARQKRGIYYNNTTGGFTITVTTGVSGAQTVTLNAGDRIELISDGINIIYAVTAIGAGSGVNTANLTVTGNSTFQGTVSALSSVSANSLVLTNPLPLTSGGTGATTQTGSTMPVGCIMPFGNTTGVAGWVLCNGQAINRVTFAALFAFIGTLHGAGDGVTTFNVPNIVDKGVFGSGNLYSIGQTGGTTTQTLSVGNIPTHNHPVNITDPGHAHGVTDPSHAHSYNSGAISGNTGTGGPLSSFSSTFAANTTSSTTGVTVNSGTTGITATTSTTGSGSSFNIVPPFIAIPFFIKS